ncbi:MAG: carbohydrate-binding family 9-like protein [Planctomycetes bacterium]|nr:carbohydrate-binding family 9-like protein [Planctomycetota bacterium]
MIHWRLLVVLILTILSAVGCSQPEAGNAPDTIVLGDSSRPVYRCRLASGPVKIDGLLDDAAWEDAPFSAEFIRRTHVVPQMPASIGTRMKVLYDERALYIAVECKDSDIWSTFTQRDDPVVLEEAAVIYVDPLGNGRDYFGFHINPLNALVDLKRRSGTLETRPRIWRQWKSWNGEGIEHAVHVDGTVNKRGDVDNGWTVEIALPFDALGVRPRPGDQWRVQVGRMNRPRMGGIVLSSWTKTSTLHMPSCFGVLVFQQ